MPNTTLQALPYPLLSDPANGPVGFQQLAQAVEKKLVQVYVDAADRTAKVVAPTAGMLSFLTATGRFEYYTGAAWVAVLALTNSTFTQSVGGAGNFIKPTAPAARLHIVELWGPGGAGGGVTGGSGAGEGGGGGSGAYLRRVYADSELAASEAYVVGAGGAGVAGANGNGGAASSTFKDLVAAAGSGGNVMAIGTIDAGSANGFGGVATNGHLNCQGGDGGKGRRLGSFVMLQNLGAACPSGGGVAAHPNFGAGTGAAGHAPGGGGAGAYGGGAAVAGGAGAPGKILVTSVY